MAITALNSTFPLEFAFTNLWKGSYGSTPIYQGPIDAHVEGAYGGTMPTLTLARPERFTSRHWS
jgi:hypothetical protein